MKAVFVAVDRAGHGLRLGLLHRGRTDSGVGCDGGAAACVGGVSGVGG